ncbi:MAG: biopolymer transporter ExbD [Endomicrobium sp.]|jgi:biopolymer transport protein ExbD|nr:biopolymer transporter ExbD [Endomicrobium sp.]
MKFNFDFDDIGDGTIDLTSLIDVMFLLLIFFILAATFTSPSIDVMLAKANSAETVSNQVERVTFSIDAYGGIYHDKQLIDKEEIPIILSGKLSDTSIVFNVDKNAPFNAFIGLMDQVKLLGYSKFLINAELEEK